MSKYTALLGVLDQIRDEAPVNAKLYRPKASNAELLNAARSRAYRRRVNGERGACVVSPIDDHMT